MIFRITKLSTKLRGNKTPNLSLKKLLAQGSSLRFLQRLWIC